MCVWVNLIAVNSSESPKTRWCHRCIFSAIDAGVRLQGARSQFSHGVGSVCWAEVNLKKDEHEFPLDCVRVLRYYQAQRTYSKMCCFPRLEMFPVWCRSMLLNFKNTCSSVHFSLNKLRFWRCYATCTKSHHKKKSASMKQVIKNELWKLHRSRFSSLLWLIVVSLEGKNLNNSSWLSCMNIRLHPSCFYTSTSLLHY